MNTHTMLLWLAPLLALLAALAVVMRGMRGRSLPVDAPAVPLSAQEQEALDQILKPRQGDGTRA